MRAVSVSHVYSQWNCIKHLLRSVLNHGAGKQSSVSIPLMKDICVKNYLLPLDFYLLYRFIR